MVGRPSEHVGILDLMGRVMWDDASLGIQSVKWLYKEGSEAQLTAVLISTVKLFRTGS